MAQSSTPALTRFSILDLAPITQGSDAATALQHTRDLEQHAERLGFHRYWLAEHHNMPGIASAATAVVIGHVAAGARGALGAAGTEGDRERRQLHVLLGRRGEVATNRLGRTKRTYANPNRFSMDSAASIKARDVLRDERFSIFSPRRTKRQLL